MSDAAGELARRIGIDVGGTKSLGVALSPEGAILAERRRPTPRGFGSLDELLVTISDLVGVLGPADRIGVGVPGLVTFDGRLRAAPNLDHVADFDVRSKVAAMLGHDVTVDNDATCAARAELDQGIARGVEELVLITLGTGIGGAIVSGGAIRRGANGFAGEAGHMVVDPDGPRCPCGQAGCWEVYASGSGLARIAREAAAAGRLDALVASGGAGDPLAVRGEDVLDAAAAGDRDAGEVIDEFARWVALGLANLTNLLDPELFVIGGGLASRGAVLASPIGGWMRELLYDADLRSIPRVEFAALGERAGAVGAALMAGEVRPQRPA